MDTRFMIFYKAKAEDGHIVIAGTQADARAVNKQFEQIDIPTDKAGLLALAQSWCDEVFELNKLMDEMRADLEGQAPADGDDLDGRAYRLALSKAAELGFSNVLDALEHVSTTPQPKQMSEALARISVEEEIQSCDLPRLAVLAQNVAWRFQELGRKAETSTWAERAAGTWHPGDEA